VLLYAQKCFFHEALEFESSYVNLISIFPIGFRPQLILPIPFVC
jgi:hypothetical protein